VSQVDGAAKGAVEHDMFWLDPNTVPTLGSRMPPPRPDRSLDPQLGVRDQGSFVCR
jgi:hypothetical protein